jgi:hypothetical protein
MKEKIVNYFMGKEWFITIVRQRFSDAVNDMNINTFALSCGLEDRCIVDRYVAMEYGVEQTLEKALEAINNVS